MYDRFISSSILMGTMSRTPPGRRGSCGGFWSAMFGCNFYYMTKRAAGAFACAYLLAVSAQARVTKFVVEKAVAAGAGRMLSGHFEGELDPKDKHNAIITDILLAPRN